MDQIQRHARAFYPDPVAYTFLDDKRVKIHAGLIESEYAGNDNARPGEILGVDKRGVLVKCGEGAYRVTAIQLPIGKGSILRPADVLNGWTDVLSPGTCFTTNQTSSQ